MKHRATLRATFFRDFKDWMEANWLIEHDARQLITGDNDAGAAMGVGSVCRADRKHYAVVGDGYTAQPEDMLYGVAHETAHLIGAWDLYEPVWSLYHPGQPLPCDAYGDPESFDLMGNYGSLNFCQYSKDEIRAWINANGHCMGYC